MRRKIVALLMSAALICQSLPVQAEEFFSQEEIESVSETDIPETTEQDKAEPEDSSKLEFEGTEELKEAEVNIEDTGEPEFSDGSELEVSDDGWESGESLSGSNGNNIPSDALYYNGHYYAVFNLHSGWEEAKAYCESLGGYLATITSQEENDAVFEYMTDQGYDSAYFGYTDEETEGTWKWVNGEKSDYTNWNPGEPNAENSKEDYAMFYYKYPEGTWNDGDFGGSTVGNDRAFICEWGDYTKEEQPKYALRPEQVWGFKQRQVSDQTGTLNLGYYTKFFSPAHAVILLLADNGSSGYCSGMATSVNAISGNGCVPVSSFQVTNLSDITNPKTTSSVTWKSAADYIKYAHVYQNKSSVQKEARKHNGDLNGLYNAVKNSVSGNGDYVEIRIRGDYAGKINIGHCLLAMGIAKDTDSETEILVYDGNFSSDLKEFYLYKQNGQVTSWKYDQRAEGFVDWGTGKPNNQITYTTPGKDFKKDVTSILDSISIDMYKYLISVENKNASIKTSNGIQSLKGSVTGDIIPLQTYNGASDSDANVYWIDTEGEISVQNNAYDNSIEVAGNNKTVSADIPVNSSVSMNLNNQNLKADVTGLSSGKSFSVTLTQYSDSAVSTAAIVSGIANTGTVNIQKENENKVNVKGVSQAEIQFQKEDGSTTTKVKVDLGGKPSQIEQNSSKTTVKQDTNGDGTYDKTVYDSSKVNIKVSAPKPGKVSAGHNFLKISWGKVSKANGYQVYRKINGGKWKSVKYVSGTSYTDKNVKAGNTYTYTVKAYQTVNGKKIFSSYNKKGISGKLTTAVSLKTKSKKVTVSWKKTTGAAGYYVYRASSAKGKYSRVKTITSGRTLKYVDSKVKKGKTYYYKVVPYGKNGKKIVKCGTSATKKIKVK